MNLNLSITFIGPLLINMTLRAITGYYDLIYDAIGQLFIWIVFRLTICCEVNDQNKLLRLTSIYQRDQHT